jgi:hypothetical protein
MQYFIFCCNLLSKITLIHILLYLKQIAVLALYGDVKHFCTSKPNQTIDYFMHTIQNNAPDTGHQHSRSWTQAHNVSEANKVKENTEKWVRKVPCYWVLQLLCTWHTWRNKERISSPVSRTRFTETDTWGMTTLGAEKVVLLLWRAVGYRSRSEAREQQNKGLQARKLPCCSNQDCQLIVGLFRST